MPFVTLALEEVVYVSSPFIIGALALSFMPIIPVLSSCEAIIDITIAITFFLLMFIVVMILSIVIVLVVSVVVVV